MQCLIECFKTVSTYRCSDRIISRARINANRSKTTTHLGPISPTRELRVRTGNDNVGRRRISISQCVRRRNFRATIALGSILDSSVDIAQLETFAHAELDGHRIARVAEDSRIQRFAGSIVIVTTLPGAAADDEGCLECLSVSCHVRRCG